MNMIHRLTTTALCIVLTCFVSLATAHADDAADAKFAAALQQLDRDSLILLCTNLQAKVARLEAELAAAQQSEAELKAFRALTESLQAEISTLKKQLGQADPTESSETSSEDGFSGWSDSDTTADQDTAQSEQHPIFAHRFQADQKKESVLDAMLYRSVAELLAVVPSRIAPQPAVDGKPLDTTHFDTWAAERFEDDDLASSGRIDRIERGEDHTTLTIKTRGLSWHKLYVTHAQVTCTLTNDQWQPHRHLRVGDPIDTQGTLDTLELQLDKANALPERIGRDVLINITLRDASILTEE